MTDVQELAIQVKQIVESGAPLEAIGASLEQLWNAAQDEQQQAIVATAWEQAQALATVVTNAVNLAETAVSVATEMIQQRDTIADELSGVVKKHMELEQAVKDIDFDHPLVSELAEIVEENIYEYIANSGYDQEGIHTENPGYDIIATGNFDSKVTIQAAENFAEVLFGITDVTPELYAELSAFIVAFNDKAVAHWDEERERYLKENAELRVRIQQQEALKGKAS